MRVLIILAALFAISYAQTDFSFDHPFMDGLNGWSVSAVLHTTGETIDHYSPPGILDGLGALKISDNRVRVFATHELGKDKGAVYTLKNGLELVGTRISWYDIDRETLKVVDAAPAYDKIFDRNGDLVTTNAQLHPYASFYDDPKVGMSRFCSANLVQKGTFNMEDDIFFAGEETHGDSYWTGGAHYALDIKRDALWAVPMFGRGSWENSCPLITDDENKVAFVFGDDHKRAPLKLYIGTKNAIGDSSFLDRNGLASGDMYVLVMDKAGVTESIHFGGTGEEMTGRFVRVDIFDENQKGTVNETTWLGFDEEGWATMMQIDLHADEVGAFLFSRPEDVGNYGDPANNVFILASTGHKNNPGDNWGTTYMISVDFPSLTAKVKIIYAADDAGDGMFPSVQDGMRNVDNLVVGHDMGLYLQEDSTKAEKHAPSVWQVDVDANVLVRISQVNYTVLPQTYSDGCDGKIGCWETSGIIDVSDLFDVATDRTMLLLDVQAHKLQDVTTGGWIEHYQEASQLVLLEGPSMGAATETEEAEEESDDMTMMYISLALIGCLALGISLYYVKSVLSGQTMGAWKDTTPNKRDPTIAAGTEMAEHE